MALYSSGILLSGCNIKHKGTESSIEQDPVVISGTNIRSLHARCAAKPTGETNQHEVLCNAVFLKDGVESVPTQIDDGLALTWSELETVTGRSPERIQCTTADRGVRNRCLVSLEGAFSVTLATTLSALNRATNELHTAHAKVSLPYTLRTFGKMPMFPIVFSSTQTAPGSLGTARGAIALGSNAAPVLSFKKNVTALKHFPFFLGSGAGFERVQSCRVAGAVYFSWGRQIFRVRDSMPGSVELVAGALPSLITNQELLAEAKTGDPLRIRFPSQPRLFCGHPSARKQGEEAPVFALSYLIDYRPAHKNPAPSALLLTTLHEDKAHTVEVPASQILLKAEWMSVGNFSVSREGVWTIPIFSKGVFPRIISGLYQVGPELNLTRLNTTLDLLPNRPDPLSVLNLEDGVLAVGFSHRPGNEGSAGGVAILSQSGALLHALGGLPAELGSYVSTAAANLTTPSRLSYFDQQLYIEDRGVSRAFAWKPSLREFTPVSFTVAGKPEPIVRAMDVGPSGLVSASYGSGFLLGIANLPAATTRIGLQYAAGATFEDYKAARSVTEADEHVELGTTFDLSFDESGNLYGLEEPQSSINKGSHLLYFGSSEGNASQKVKFQRKPLPMVSTEIPSSYPTTLARSKDGLLFTATRSGTFQIARTSPTGISEVVAGTGAKGFSGDGGPALTAEIGNVLALAVAEGGDIFFSDSTNLRIRRLTLDANGKYAISTVAGNGVRAWAKPGPATNSPTMGPERVRWSGGSVYFSESAQEDFALHGVDSTGTLFTISRPHGTNANLVWEVTEESQKGISVSDFDITASGEIYVADNRTGRLLVLRPIAGRETEHAYRVEVLVEKNVNSRQCGFGTVEKSATSTGVNSAWKATLNQICTSRRTSIAVRDQCHTPQGMLSIALAQATENGFLGETGMVILSTRACHTP